MTIFVIFAILPLFTYQAAFKKVSGPLFLLVAIPLLANLICCLIDHVLKRRPLSVKNWAFVLFHFSFLIIIVGGGMSYATRTEGIINLVKGQEVIDYPHSYHNWHERLLAGKGTGSKIVLEDMLLEYWPNMALKEITNTVRVKPLKGKSFRYVLDANTPLYHQGRIVSMTRFYGLSPLFNLHGPQGIFRGNVMVGEEKKESRFTIPQTAIAGTMRLVDPQKELFHLTLGLGGKIMVDRHIKKGDSVSFGDYQLSLEHVTLWSGLSVVHDPWRYLVYAGFVLFLGSIIVFYRFQLRDE